MTKNLFSKILLCGAALFSWLATQAKEVEFDKVFADSTLRIDMTLAGNAKDCHVFLNRQSKTTGWYGRRHNLAKLPLLGNGIVTVTDSLTNDTIYRHSFSTLFQEWRDTPEAEQISRSYENSFLLPLPKRAAKITVELLDSRHRTVASNTHIYSPADILVSVPKPSKTAKYSKIHTGGSPKKAIDVVILAEGYTEAERDSFFTDAAEAVDAIFSHEPFASHRKDFNFMALWTPSEESGMSVPRDQDWRNTAFGSHYDTFYSARYLTTPNVRDIYDSLDGQPFEHIIILANSPVYGGGGIYNSYTLTTSKNDNFRPVVVHEFGHSFGGLADEYFYENDIMSDIYPLDVEPWEPNITTLTDFASKWEPLLEPGTPVPTPVDQAERYPVGVYEGGGYSFKGVYRPADRCRMRDNTWPGFCPACQRALEALINFYTGR